MRDIDIVFEKVSMEELLEHYGFTKHRNGKYKCPFHGDTNPSANIWHNGKDWFKCFACGENLNVIDFVVKYEEVDRKTAIAKLDKKFGLGLFNTPSPEESKALQDKRTEMEKNLKKEKFYQKYEKQVLNEICKAMETWKKVENICHITREEYRTGNWQLADLYFYSLKKQEWLSWLYDAVCGFNHDECEYDYIYGNDKKEILRNIYKGVISI